MAVITRATSNARAVASLAEKRKLVFYGNLLPRHYFMPVAFETSGVIDAQSRLFLKELNHCITLKTFWGKVGRLFPALSFGCCWNSNVKLPQPNTLCYTTISYSY